MILPEFALPGQGVGEPDGIVERNSEGLMYFLTTPFIE